MREEGRATPGGVIAVGIVSILFGVLGLLAGVFQIGTFLLAAREHDLPGATMLFAAVPYCLFGIAWIAAGGGLFKFKAWARTTTIVLSILTAAFSAVLFIVIAAVFTYVGVAVEGPPPAAMLVVGAVVGIILLCIFVGVPIGFLVYLNGESVKRRFSSSPGTIRRPLGVNILIAWYFLSVLSLLSLVQSRGGPVCGSVLEGAWFQLYMVLCVGVSVYIALGFFRLKRRAWLTALCYNAFVVANTLLNLFLIPPEELLRLSHATVRNPELYIRFFSISLLVGAAVTAAIAFYLLKKRAVFVS